MNRFLFHWSFRIYFIIQNEPEEFEQSNKQRKTSEIHESPYYSEINDLETAYATKNIPHMVNITLFLEGDHYFAFKEHCKIIDEVSSTCRKYICVWTLEISL